MYLYPIHTGKFYSTSSNIAYFFSKNNRQFKISMQHFFERPTFIIFSTNISLLIEFNLI